jgi:hypothetical protein
VTRPAHLTLWLDARHLPAAQLSAHEHSDSALQLTLHRALADAQRSAFVWVTPRQVPLPALLLPTLDPATVRHFTLRLPDHWSALAGLWMVRAFNPQPSLTLDVTYEDL